MEISYCQLRQKEVINLKDGKRLGRVNDLVFTFPEGKVLGIVVPGGRGFFRPGIFIDIRNVVKIGEDTVLVEVRHKQKTAPPPPKHGHGYTQYEEEDCSPKSKYINFEEDE